MAAHMLAEPPRDFRPGTFKFRSTPTGALPTDADLLRTLTEGVRWTGMIGRPDLPEADRRALVAFIKTLSPRFRAEPPGKPIAILQAPPATPALIREGQHIYKDAGCDECHGPAGRGDGPAARGQRDAWGHPTHPSDITWRPLKRGADPAEIYRTVVTGLDGSPMPAHGDVLEPSEAWALVAFLETLVPPEQRAPSGAVLGEERAGWMILRMHGGGLATRIGTQGH
jgi:mono/diheme cytochrome c family protein